MKIRNDFVTNSSSSSFCVSLDIKLEKGVSKSTPRYDGDYYSCEDNGEIFVEKSPRQMAECETVDELLDMINKSVHLDEHRPVFKSNSRFIKDIQELSSMNEIKEISLSSREYYRDNAWHTRNCSYDLDSGEYKMTMNGGCRESEGGGGGLVFNDYTHAIVGAGSDTMCKLTYTLYADDGKKSEYKITGCKKTEDYLEEYEGDCKSIKISRGLDELDGLGSLEEIEEALNKTLLVDKNQVELGTILINGNESVNEADDIFMITLELDEMVLGDQDLLKYRVVYIEGNTKYEYDFRKHKGNVKRRGNIFEHTDRALVELKFEKKPESSYVRKVKPVQISKAKEKENKLLAALRDPAREKWISGMIFVQSGITGAKKSELENVIKANGGWLEGSVTGEINYFINGEKDGHESAKLKKAKKLNASGRGISIMAYDEWLKKLEEGFSGTPKQDTEEKSVNVLNLKNMPLNTETLVIPASVEKLLFNRKFKNLKNIEIANENRNYMTDGSAIFTKDGKTLLKFMIGSAETYSVPDGTKKIAKGAFKGMEKIKEILLPDSVVSVNDDEIYKFLKNNAGLVIFKNKLMRCNLEERVIKIPDGVKEICKGAFKDCSRAVEISIPDGVKKIGWNAFRECNSLEKINLPDSVQEIEGLAFKGCSTLKEIKIPDGIQKIAQGIFLDCGSLKEIRIPDSVQEIGGCAFEGCSALEEITIPDSVQEIGDNAFEDCSSLKEIKIPDGVKTIGDSERLFGGMFKGCSALEEITIPDSVQKIGEYAFKGCSSLKKIKIPDSVQEIGESAFEGCSLLKEIRLPDGVPEIGFMAFRDCSALEAITIPDSVQEIGGAAFAGCSSLKAIKIPAGVKTIWAGTFSGCSSLEEINLPDSIQEIIGGAFQDCSALKEIKIPDSVKKIGKDAFEGCSSLDKIKLPW